MQEAKELSLGCIVCIVICALLIIGGIGLTVFDLTAQREIINPQIVKNKIDDPDKVIADRNAFHSEIAEIVKADNDIISKINQLKNYSKGDAMYDQLQSDLAGIEQIRTSAITRYDGDAQDTTKVRHMDQGMPTSISEEPLTGTNEDISSQLTKEIHDIQQYSTPVNN